MLKPKKQKQDTLMDERSTDDNWEASVKTSVAKPDYDSIRSITKIVIDGVQLTKEVRPS